MRILLTLAAVMLFTVAAHAQRTPDIPQVSVIALSDSITTRDPNQPAHFRIIRTGRTTEPLEVRMTITHETEQVFTIPPGSTYLDVFRTLRHIYPRAQRGNFDLTMAIVNDDAYEVIERVTTTTFVFERPTVWISAVKNSEESVTFNLITNTHGPFFATVNITGLGDRLTYFNPGGLRSSFTVYRSEFPVSDQDTLDIEATIVPSDTSTYDVGSPGRAMRTVTMPKPVISIVPVRDLIEGGRHDTEIEFEIRTSRPLARGFFVYLASSTGAHPEKILPAGARSVRRTFLLGDFNSHITLIPSGTLLEFSVSVVPGDDYIVAQGEGAIARMGAVIGPKDARDPPRVLAHVARQPSNYRDYGEVEFDLSKFSSAGYLLVETRYEGRDTSEARPGSNTSVTRIGGTAISQNIRMRVPPLPDSLSGTIPYVAHVTLRPRERDDGTPIYIPSGPFKNIGGQFGTQTMTVTVKFPTAHLPVITPQFKNAMVEDTGFLTQTVPLILRSTVPPPHDLFVNVVSGDRGFKLRFPAGKYQHEYDLTLTQFMRSVKRDQARFSISAEVLADSNSRSTYNYAGRPRSLATAEYQPPRIDITVAKTITGEDHSLRDGVFNYRITRSGESPGLVAVATQNYSSEPSTPVQRFRGQIRITEEPRTDFQLQPTAHCARDGGVPQAVEVNVARGEFVVDAGNARTSLHCTTTSTPRGHGSDTAHLILAQRVQVSDSRRNGVFGVRVYDTHLGQADVTLTTEGDDFESADSRVIHTIIGNSHNVTSLPVKHFTPVNAKCTTEGTVTTHALSATRRSFQVVPRTVHPTRCVITSRADPIPGSLDLRLKQIILSRGDRNLRQNGTFNVSVTPGAAVELTTVGIDPSHGFQSAFSDPILVPADETLTIRQAAVAGFEPGFAACAHSGGRTTFYQLSASNLSFELPTGSTGLIDCSLYSYSTEPPPTAGLALSVTVAPVHSAPNERRNGTFNVTLSPLGYTATLTTVGTNYRSPPSQLQTIVDRSVRVAVTAQPGFSPDIALCSFTDSSRNMFFDMSDEKPYFEYTPEARDIECLIEMRAHNWTAAQHAAKPVMALRAVSTGATGTFNYQGAGAMAFERSITTAEQGVVAEAPPVALAEGETVVTQEKAEGFSMVGAACTHDGKPMAPRVDLEAGTVAMKMPESGKVMCTITNRGTAERTEKLVRNFLRRRAENLTADTGQSRLIERRRAAVGTPGLKGSGDGDTGDITTRTSLAQLGGYKSKWDVWTEATWNYRRSEGGSSGRFGLFRGGVDYLAHENLLIGITAQYDYLSDESDKHSISGHGWMVGPYVEIGLTKNLVLDVKGLWGQSKNEVSPDLAINDDFSTSRWLAAARLTGSWTWAQSAHSAWHFKPTAEVVWFAEESEAFVNSYGVGIGSQRVSQGRLKAGPEISYTFNGKDGTRISPRFGAQVLWNFAGSNIEGDGEGVGEIPFDEFQARFTGGLDIEMPGGARFKFEGAYTGLGSQGEETIGGKVGVTIPLQ